MVLKTGYKKEKRSQSVKYVCGSASVDVKAQARKDSACQVHLSSRDSWGRLLARATGNDCSDGNTGDLLARTVRNMARVYTVRTRMWQ